MPLRRVIPAAKAVNPAAKVVSPAAKVVSPAAKVVSPAAKVVSPAAKAVSPAAKAVSPAAKVVSPAAKVVSPAAKAVIPAAKAVSPAAKAVIPAKAGIHPRAARGLTLIEMLVVLVLVSLLGTLLIQGGGFFLGQYATVKRVHRDASLAELRRHWFASTLQAMVPSKVEARRFAGDASSFEGVTLQALAAEPGLPVRVRWSIDGDAASHTVVYEEEDTEPWTVLSTQGDALAFQYADSARQWHERWPVAEDARERIPRRVRLVSAGGATLWLAHLDLYPEPVPNYREEF